MKAFWFVALYYLKYFCVITAGLGLFFVGIDVLKLASDLPDSANMLILFIFYDFAYALGFILPISILLSEVMVLSVLLRNNEFAALLSLGHSKRQIALPIFVCAALLLTTFVALNATPFAYSKEEVDRIINKNFTNRSKQEILVKHQNNYIYFDKVYPFAKRAEGIRIYTLNDNTLTRLVQATNAIFVNNEWQLLEVILFDFNTNAKLGDIAYTQTKLPRLEILKGFKPKILDIIYEKSDSVSILDALSSLLFLQNQNIDSTKIRGILYSLIFFPFFCFPMLVILLRFMPLTVRYGELSWFVFASILMSLMAWGVFFALSRFAMSGFIHPEWAFVLPMILWFLLGFVVALRLNRYEG